MIIDKMLPWDTVENDGKRKENYRMTNSKTELTENEKEIIQALRRIARIKNADAELRNNNDGTFRVFKVDKEKMAG